MLTYIARRLLFLPVVLIGVTLMIFVAMSFLSPYQLVSTYIKSPEEFKNQSLDDLVRKYGLDQPVHVRYLNWIKNLLKGDLGYSVSANMHVTEAIAKRFPATVELALFAIIPVILGGIWLGTISAKHYNKPLDHLSRVFAIVGWSLPDFVFGLIMLMIFYGVLGWFPPGRLSMWADTIVLTGDFVRYTGMNTVDALLNRRLDIFWDAVRHMIAPVLTLSYLWWAYLLRITRSSMLEVMNKDYVRTARAKGLSQVATVGKHVLRNAMAPVITVMGLNFGGLLGGTVVTESVFAINGVGRMMVRAITSRDFPVVQGAVLLVATTFVLINLLVDIAYAMLDPRIRYD